MVDGVILVGGQENVVSLLLMVKLGSLLLSNTLLEAKIIRDPPEVIIYCVKITATGMEGWGVHLIMEEFKSYGFKVTRVLHDKDSSTMKNVMDVYEDVEEALCFGTN